MQDKNRDLFHLISTNTIVNEAAPDAERALKEKEWLHLITVLYHRINTPWLHRFISCNSAVAGLRN